VKRSMNDMIGDCVTPALGSIRDQVRHASQGAADLLLGNFLDGYRARGSGVGGRGMRQQAMCSCAGSAVASRGVRQTFSIRQGCPYELEIKECQDDWFVLNEKCNFGHSHLLPESRAERAAFAHTCEHVPPAIIEEAKEMQANGAWSSSEIAQFLHKRKVGRGTSESVDWNLREITNALSLDRMENALDCDTFVRELYAEGSLTGAQVDVHRVDGVLDRAILIFCDAINDGQINNDMEIMMDNTFATNTWDFKLGAIVDTRSDGSSVIYGLT